MHERDGASPVSTVDLLIRCHCNAHILDHARGKLAGFYFGGAFHQALEIVGHFFLFDGALQALLDQIGGFGPSEMAEHHDAGQNDRAGIDDIFVGVLGSGAVGGFEDGVTVADVRSGSDAEAPDLRCARIGDVVAVQVGRGQNAIFIGPRHYLLENGVGDAVIDHQLFLPCAFAVRGIDGIDAVFYLFVEVAAETVRGELEAALDEVRVLLDSESGILVLVVNDPALALGDDMSAEFFRGEFVSPLAERTFGELLDVAFVYERDRLVLVVESMLDGHAHQTFRAGHGHGFDADAGVEADLLLAAFQHVLVEEFDQAFGVGRAFFPFDSGVNVFCVLAEDDNVHALGMLHGRRHTGVVLHRTHAAVEIENLAQGDVEGADAASDGRGQRTFDGDAEFADGADGVVWKPILKASLGLLSGKNFVPGNGALTLIRLFDSGIEDADGGFPNIAARAIAFDERNDRVIGDAVLAVAIFDLLPMGWDRHSVERRHDACLQKRGRNFSL